MTTNEMLTDLAPYKKKILIFSDYYLGDQSVWGPSCLLTLDFINAPISDTQFGNQCLLHHFSLKDPIIHNWFNRNERLTINETQLLTLLRWIIELLRVN